MEMSRKSQIVLWLSLILAALILGIPINKTWAEPVRTAQASSSGTSSLTSAVPAECVTVDKNVRKATRLSTILDASKNAVIGPSSPNGVYLDDRIPKELGRIEIQPGGKLFVPDSPVDIKVGTIVVAGMFRVGTESCPIGTLNPGNRVIVRFVGERPVSIDRTKDDCENPVTFQKGIQVAQGGMS